MNLRLRIILTYILLVAASFSCIIYFIVNDVRPRYLEAVEEVTVDMAELLAAILAQQAADGTLRFDIMDTAMREVAERTLSARIYNILKRKVRLNVYVTDARGILLYDSTGESAPGTDFSNWRDVALTLEGQYGARSTRKIPEDPNSRVIFVAAPILKHGQLYGVVSVGKPTDSITFLIAIAQKRFGLGLALVGITAITLGILLSAWLTRPLHQLITYTKAVQAGKTPPLPPLGSSEMGMLAAAMDEMRVKLEGKHYIEDYVRALTHEMKSPLTGIKGAAEILRDTIHDERSVKFLQNIEADSSRLHSLIERMLYLSRLENAHSIHKIPIDMQAFFVTLCESFAAQCAAAQITLRTDIAPDLTHIAGDPLLLQQVFSNLISNALDFSLPQSCILIAATADKACCHFSIKDQGTGIPDFALPKVFDKFFSLPRPQNGKKSSGLGLSFVREVIHLHGGSIYINNLNPGLEVCFSLPQR